MWSDTNWKNSDMVDMIKKVHKQLGWDEDEEPEN